MGTFSVYEYEDEIRHRDRFYIYNILNVFFKKTHSFSVIISSRKFKGKRNVGGGGKAQNPTSQRWSVLYCVNTVILSEESRLHFPVEYHHLKFLCTHESSIQHLVCARFFSRYRRRAVSQVSVSKMKKNKIE